MDIDGIIDHVTGLDGVLVLRPQPGDGSPEISWGDAFFYYSPDGNVPATQPFATIVTKDYPDEPPSGLDQTDAFRLNIAAPSAEFVRLVGSTQQGAVRSDQDAQVRDTWFPHPVYGAAGWVAVVNPDTQRSEALHLLDLAHRAARDRSRRREGPLDAG